MSKLDAIFDDWLVHDEGCLYSLTDQAESCDCIQTNVKENISREVKALMLELIGGDNYAPTGSQFAVEVTNRRLQSIRQKIDEL